MSKTNTTAVTFMSIHSSTSSEPVPPTKSARRHPFSQLKKKVGNKYLFLDSSNKKDYNLMMQVASERPYKLDYGNKESGWDAIAINLTKTRVGVSSFLFGEEGISSKAVKNRFTAIMGWCKDFQAQSPFQSGTDDEPDPTDLLNLIEEEYAVWKDHEDSKDAEKVSKLTRQKIDRDQAAAIRDASIGKLTNVQLVQSKADKVSNKRATPDASPTKMNISGLIDLAVEKLGDTETKAKSKAARLGLAESPLKLDCERFELEQDERKQRMKGNEARNTQQSHMQGSLLEVLKKLSEK